MRRIACLVIVVALAAQAKAAPIAIFNTGVDGTGTPLPDGTVGDPHYSLVSNTTGDPTGAVLVRTSAGGFPIPPWLGDNATSAWIGPHTDASLDGGVGNFDYQTTFNAPGPGSITVVGQWSTDNPGLNILINGVPSGSTSGGFGSFTPFSITDPVVAGTNTLDFIVNNQGGPTGLRAEISSANFTPVPEPASCVLFGLGAAVVFVSTRRRKG